MDSRRLSAFAACIALAASTAACATTGLAWVHERESGADLTPPAPPAEGEPSAARPADLRFDDEAVAAPEERARRRLDRSITLGGVTEFDARALDVRGQAVDPRGTTIVNVYVNGTAQAPIYGYGFGTSFAGAPVAAGVRIPSAPPALRPGLDWPAVPNHGPVFPYRTGPASPWTGADPRRH